MDTNIRYTEIKRRFLFVEFKRCYDRGFMYLWSVKINLIIIEVKIDKTGWSFAIPPRYSWNIYLWKNKKI